MGHNQTENSQANILIVDDTPANLRLLSQMLSEGGYYVRPVPAGSLALAAVEAEHPDLILLDIKMPEMDGYQVCERLKADPQAREIPIIFISALDSTRDKVKAFRVGGVDYVTKPFQVEEVLARVETHLTLRNMGKQIQEANRKMAQELALAGEVQASFLPGNPPDIPGWQLAGKLLPARQMSGDFYDYVPLPNGCLGILIADVSDKGAGAALYMALSLPLIRTYALEYPSQPEKVLSAVNRRIAIDTRCYHFVTAFYGVLEPETGKLTYCNAGHCPPLCLSADEAGSVQRLARTGTVLGLFPDETFESTSVQMDPGDSMIIYTDGITEARNAHRSLFGDELLLESVQARWSSPVHEIQAAILADLKDFVGDTPQSDDIALIILKRDSPGAT
jgi:sigma-B regulation protein RsbU (phosphoserine phosphatase)